MRFKKGDKVRVTGTNGVFARYLQWLCENKKDVADKLPHWVYDRHMTDDKLYDEWTVIHSSSHLDTNKILVFIDNGKESYIIDEDYLALNTEKLNWEDLKVGDVIRKKDGKEVRMVTGIYYDEADCHVYIGFWLSDVELKDWEKVEHEVSE